MLILAEFNKVLVLIKSFVFHNELLKKNILEQIIVANFSKKCVYSMELLFVGYATCTF